MKRLDNILIVAALILAFATIAAVIVRAGGHELTIRRPATAVEAPARAAAS